MFRSALRHVRTAGALCTIVLGASCLDRALAPQEGAPYLAVLVSVSAPDEVTSRGPFRFRVRELSGTLRYDTLFNATPADTTILSVEPATYVIEIGDVPSTCGIRDGAQVLVVPPNTNTTVARFTVICRNAITVSVLSDGQRMDSGYVYTVENKGGVVLAGPLAPNDTVLLDNVAPGAYDVSLRLVQDNCTVVSDGGATVPIEVLASGGATINYRVTCSELSRRPRIMSLKGSYHSGGVGFVMRVVDPDRDVERYAWDVTDCNRRSVLTGGQRRRGGFAGWPNVTGKDTATIVGAYEIPLSEAEIQGRCMAVYVGDERGNISEILEVPLAARNAFASPGALRFNAFLIGQQFLRVLLEVIDPNDDYAGAFIYYNLRDGILVRPPDGLPDRLVFQPPGVLNTQLSDLPFGIGYGAWNDYLSVTVFLVDREGNTTRIEDGDLFQ